MLRNKFSVSEPQCRGIARKIQVWFELLFLPESLPVKPENLANISNRRYTWGSLMMMKACQTSYTARGLAENYIYIFSVTA